MGIKKGNTLINKYGKDISLEKLRGNIVIVDLFYLLHKFTRVNISKPLYYIFEVINFIEKFKFYGIIPIFVIDGKPLVEKTKKIQRTKNKSTIKLNKLLETENLNNVDLVDNIKANTLLKKSISINKEHIDKCKDLFDRLDCLHIHITNCEGDTVIAELVSLLQKDLCVDDNVIVYVYSADFDMFLYTSIKYILKELDFDKDTFKLYIKEVILNDLNITHDELILSGFITGTDYNCGLYKATMESSIELIKSYGPFKTLNDFLYNLPVINNNRPENHKILIPSYNFIDRYVLVTNIFSLNNTSKFNRTSIIKFINENYLKIKKQNQTKNTLSNFFIVKYVLDYILSITQDSYLIKKYSAKITDYSILHFGIKFVIDIDDYDDYHDYDD